MNCSFMQLPIYTRGIGNTCFSYMWRENMIILLHVMLHMIHVALECIHGEDIGRKWGTWEAMDEPERWRKRVKDLDGGYDLDLVEEFFASLDLN